MVLGSPMEKYSDTSPCIIDHVVVRSWMKQNSCGGMWDRDKETRQSNSNAAYEGFWKGWKRNIQTPISTCFNVSAAFCVSVCLSFFAYMSLNYVAILYKSLHVSASKYHPVVLSSSRVCSPVPPPLALSSSSLISLFCPLLFLITVLSQSARRSRFLDPSCPLGQLMNLPAPLCCAA